MYFILTFLYQVQGIWHSNLKVKFLMKAPSNVMFLILFFREPHSHPHELTDPYFHPLMTMDMLQRHNPFIFNPFLNPYAGLWIPPPQINEHPSEESSS